MKLVLSDSNTMRKSEFGDFELEVNKGWKISEQFIDFESGFLVVRTSSEDETTWTDNGFGSRSIPTKQFIVDVKERQILTADEWRKYFSYDPIIITCENDTVRLTITRVHHAESNNDIINEEVLEIATSKVISTSSGVAFNKEKRENSLERREKERLRLQKLKEKEDAKLTAEQLHEEALLKLKVGPVFTFIMGVDYYELSYNGTNFDLGNKGEAVEQAAWYYGKPKPFRSFETLQEFWDVFTSEFNWYIKCSPTQINQNSDTKDLMIKFVVSSLNEVRRQQKFTYRESSCILNWQHAFSNHERLKERTIKQYCSNCHSEVVYDPRYPTYICGACYSALKAKDGRSVTFYNVGMSGGCQGYYTDVTPNELYHSYECYLGQEKYFATEGRFGGIVIQKEGWAE